MISIEKALEIYSDKLNNYEDIDLSYFKKQLSKADYKEFLELIKFINLSKSEKETMDFEKRFDELDKYKNEYYSNQQVSGFRSEDGSNKKKAIEKLDKIFREEFDEDE